MPLMKKERRTREGREPGYAVFETGGLPRKGKLRTWLFACVVLSTVLVALGGLAYLFSPVLDEAHNEASEQAVTLEKAAPEGTVTGEEAGSVAPEDPTLYLTVPKLGIYRHTVRNDSSEEALGLGAIKLPSTGFPWDRGDTNTYIACHRVGFPGTESYNQCLDLPMMQEGDEVVLEDANGAIYRYQISETLAVTPDDTRVTEPLEGRDVISLQTCIEDLDDLSTLGPDWEGRFVVRADRVG